MSHLPGKFVWFEHRSADTAAARRFYEPLFGWRVEATPLGDHPYLVIRNGAQDIGGFAAAPGEDAPAAWMSYLSVDDVDARYQAALAAGARSVMPPTDFAPIGRAAVVVDPGGATVSLWKNTEGDPADGQVPFGGWYWNELTTHDAARAVAFYAALADYADRPTDIGQDAPYHVLAAGGTPRAGVYQVEDPALPAMWVPYVHVADCDATVEQAESLGAGVFMPPTDIPGVGRMAMLRDPLGAPIAVIRGMPAPG